jgi:cell division protein FtsL
MEFIDAFKVLWAPVTAIITVAIWVGSLKHTINDHERRIKALEVDIDERVNAIQTLIREEIGALREELKDQREAVQALSIKVAELSTTLQLTLKNREED